MEMGNPKEMRKEQGWDGFEKLADNDLYGGKKLQRGGGATATASFLVSGGKNPEEALSGKG